MCIIILRRDLLLHSHGALLPAPTPRRLLDGRPPRIHRRWRPRLRSFGPSRHRQATRARHCRPGLERCRRLPGATAADSPIRSDYAMSTAPVVPDAPAPRATASPPPAHIFKDKKNQSRGSSVPRTALRTSLGDGIGGLFACTCFPRSMPARTAIPGNRWATRCPPRWPGGEPDTPADTTAGWCPSPLTSPHVALAALAPKATGRLASRPARAIYRPRPRRHPLPAAI